MKILLLCLAMSGCTVILPAPQVIVVEGAGVKLPEGIEDRDRRVEVYEVRRK